MSLREIRSTFNPLRQSAGLYLVAAAGLRLGVFPLHLPYTSEATLRRGIGTSLRLVSAVSSLVLLAHIPAESLTSALNSVLDWACGHCGALQRMDVAARAGRINGASVLGHQPGGALGHFRLERQSAWRGCLGLCIDPGWRYAFSRTRRNRFG